MLNTKTPQMETSVVADNHAHTCRRPNLNRMHTLFRSCAYVPAPNGECSSLRLSKRLLPVPSRCRAWRAQASSALRGQRIFFGYLTNDRSSNPWMRTALESDAHRPRLVYEKELTERRLHTHDNRESGKHSFRKFRKSSHNQGRDKLLPIVAVRPSVCGDLIAEGL